MKIPSCLLLLVAMTTPGYATEVYQSTDEQGNVVFSDTPSENSETIEIQAPNVGDSVDLPPPAPEPEAKPETRTEPQPAEQPTVIIVNEKDDGDGRLHRPKPRPKPRPDSRR